MSLLTLVQDAMSRCGFERPSIVYASSDQTVQQFLAFSQEAGDAEIDFHGWRSQKVLGQMTGDGTSTEFSLPTDFDRFMPGNPLWLDNTPSVPLRKVTDEEMMSAKIADTAPTRPVWRLFGDTIEFYPAIDNAAIVKMEYRSRYWIADETGVTRQERWAADTDISLIPERIILLSTIWRWKQEKGFVYDEHFRAWEIARNTAAYNHNAQTPMRIGRPIFHPGLATGVIGDVPDIVP